MPIFALSHLHKGTANMRFLEEAKYTDAKLHNYRRQDCDKNFHTPWVFVYAINVAEYLKALYFQLFICL